MSAPAPSNGSVGRNELKALWAAGGSAVGGWCNTGVPFLAELMALQGFDYVCLDEQHGLMGYDRTVSALFGLARTGTTAIVRVPSDEPGLIGKMLDAGAEGVIIPMVETVEGAERAVAACRYAPDGRRSFGSLRGSLRFGSDPAYVNGQVACIPMIETKLGVENAEAICAVPGVDAVYIGPADLAITLGVPPGLAIRDGVHRDSIAHVLDAARRAGVPAGIQCANGDAAKAAMEQGFTMVTACIDSTLVREGCQAQLAAAGRAPAPAAPATQGLYS